MRILFCTNCYDEVTNGPAKFARNLINYSKSNTDVDFFILSEDIKTGSKNEFKVILNVPKYLRYLSQFIRMIKYSLKAREYDSKYNFDFIVYNNALIGSVHSLLSSKVIGMINDEKNIIRAFHKKMFIKIPTRNFVFQFFEMIAVKNMSKIIVNSFYLKKTLDDKYKISNTIVLHKGIDNDLVSGFDFNILKMKKKRLITFIKTDYKIGGLEILIKALKYIHSSFHLNVVGVPKNITQKLFSNLDYEISWFEKLDQKNVFKMLKNTEVFCLPSHSETFGVANLEAVAHCCKIVTTKIGGIPEALENYKNVTLIEDPYDYNMLAQAINESFATDFEKDKNMKDKLKKYSYDSVYGKFTNILKSI